MCFCALVSAVADKKIKNDTYIKTNKKDNFKFILAKETYNIEKHFTYEGK